MRYISDLRIGRINLKHLKFGIDAQSKKYNLPEFITQQVAGAGNVQSVLDQIEPPYAGYRRIESALKQYLNLAAKGDGRQSASGHQNRGSGRQRMQELLNWLHDCSCWETFRRVEASIPIAGPLSRESNIFRQDMVSRRTGDWMRRLWVSWTLRCRARVQQIDDALERWRWMPVEFHTSGPRQHSGVSAKGLFRRSPACAQHERRCGQGRANPNAGVYRRHTVHRFPALLERPP